MSTSRNSRTWKIALLDLDGTLYRGDTPIPGAVEFVERLRARGIQPVYFTNNATRTPDDVCAKLRRMGFSATPNEVCTSAQAAARHIRHRMHVAAGAKVGVVGQSGLLHALTEEGLEPEYVAEGANLDACSAAVLGLDQTVTYHRLALFCALTHRLGGYVLTNADVRLPQEDTFLPGNGALGSFVNTATGVQPYIAGKPNADYVAYALGRFGAAPSEAVVIGDNVATDIACGIVSGVYTIHVQSGVAYGNRERSNEEQTWVADETFQSVADLFLD